MITLLSWYVDSGLAVGNCVDTLDLGILVLTLPFGTLVAATGVPCVGVAYGAIILVGLADTADWARYFVKLDHDVLPSYCRH